MQCFCDKFIRPSIFYPRTLSTYSTLSPALRVCLSLSQLLSVKGRVQPKIPTLVGLFLFLPNFLLMSQFAPYWVKVEPRRRSLSESSWTLTVTFWVDSFSFKRISLIGSRMNVSFWCHVSLSLPPSLSPSIPHPDVPIRVSGNTECTCCRLIGASVHADSCTHGPRSKRRLNEGTVLFVLMVNSSQITVLRRQFSLKINKWINKYKKNQLALTHKLLSNRKQVCRLICRRTAAKKRFTPQNRIKSMEEETRVLVDLM